MMRTRLQTMTHIVDRWSWNRCFNSNYQHFEFPSPTTQNKLGFLSRCFQLDFGIIPTTQTLPKTGGEPRYPRYGQYVLDTTMRKQTQI